MATGSVCIAVVKGSYFWTPEKQGEERVWCGHHLLLSPQHPCVTRQPQLLSHSPGSSRAQPQPFPPMAKVFQGCLTVWGFCPCLGLKTSWTGIAFCPSEAQLVSCCYAGTKGWTLLCSTELTVWAELIQNSWKFQKIWNRKNLNTAKSWASAPIFFFSMLLFLLLFLPFFFFFFN